MPQANVMYSPNKNIRYQQTWHTIEFSNNKHLPVLHNPSIRAIISSSVIFLRYLFRSKLLELFLSDCHRIWYQLQADLVAATDKNYTQVFGQLQIGSVLLEVTVVTPSVSSPKAGLMVIGRDNPGAHARSGTREIRYCTLAANTGTYNHSRYTRGPSELLAWFSVIDRLRLATRVGTSHCCCRLFSFSRFTVDCDSAIHRGVVELPPSYP